MHSGAAPVENLQVQNLERAAPVVDLRQIIPVCVRKCQDEIFLFEVCCQVLYNIYIT
jgi:hypothetical protein